MPARINGIEERELRELYEDKGISLGRIGDYYNVGESTIWRRMKEYGIERRSIGDANKKDFGVTKRDLEYKYKVEEMSIQSIADYYGINHCTIGNRMREYKIEIQRGSHGRTRKYSINEEFFKQWTPESAWMFGWALGDGCFTGSLHLQFSLARVDREVLEKFKIVLESEHLIFDYGTWSNIYMKYYPMARLQFCSKRLISDLKKLSFYDIPEHYFNHALRGFFEAEGCVYWNKNKRLIKGGYITSIITQNDNELLDFILRRLHELGIVKGGSIHPGGGSLGIHFIVNDSISLYHYMYGSGDNMFLKRKKELFEELIERQLRTNGLARPKRNGRRKAGG